MSRPQWCVNPALLFIFSLVLFLTLMWYPCHNSDHQTDSHKPVTDPHDLRTIFGPSFLSLFGSSTNSEAGNVQEFGGLSSYITGSFNSNRAILMVTDIYGYEVPHLRKLADKFAAAGYFVVAPDFYHGDPYVPSPSRSYSSWLKDHPTEKGAEEAKPVIEALKSKGISAIGAAGFCWGGRVVTLLGNSSDLKAVAMAHPAYVTVDDIKEVKVPISILGGELDTLSPPSLIEQFKEILSAKPQVPSFVKIFPGVGHGWTLRYNDTDKAALRSANEAHRYMLAWFNKYVHY